MGSIGANRSLVSTTFRAPGVDESTAVNINRVLENGVPYGDQTVLIGERVGGRNTLLGTEEKKTLIKAVKDELKRRGQSVNVSITTPRMGPNMYSQYLNIRKK